MFRNPYADGLIILVVVLLFFGPKRLPELGRSLGQGMREFKDSITGSRKDEQHPEIEQAAAMPAPAPTPAATVPAAAGTEHPPAEARPEQSA
jgi:sec-independent protein translocase protein TatA